MSQPCECILQRSFPGGDHKTCGNSSCNFFLKEGIGAWALCKDHLERSPIPNKVITEEEYLTQKVIES